jgi:hypothetical protein
MVYELKVCSGLGNRLQAMVVACCMEEPPARIAWLPQHNHCPAHAAELIDITTWPFVVVHHLSQPHAVYQHIVAPQQTLPRYVMSGALFHQVDSFAGMAVAAARYIRPAKRIKAAIPVLNYNNCVGIHVRRGDKAKLCGRDDSLAKLLRVLQQHSHTVHIIVVATDSSAMYQQIKQRYGRSFRVIRPTPHVGRHNVAGAAVDFFTMIECRHFVGNRGSSFSRMIQLIRTGRRKKK